MAGDPATDPAPGRRVIAGRSLRWSEERASAAYAAGLWADETLADALAKAAAETPARVALIDGAHRIDCATLLARARSLASWMVDRMPAGSVVSFMLPNWHEAATIYFATTLAGMVAHPILPSLRERELEFMLADVDSRIVFIPAETRGHDHAAMLASVCAQMAASPEVVVLRGARLDGQLDFAALGKGNAASLPAVDPDAVGMVLYTSGTTGTPKGVMHSQNSIRALVRQLAQHWRIDPGDTFLVPSSVSHIGGSIYAFEIPVLLGTTALLMERWDAAQALEIALEHPFTHLAGATPFLEQLLDAAQRAGDHLPALKMFICGGAAVPPQLIEAAAGHFASAVVTRVYGSTEVPVITVGTTDRDDVRHAANTDGRPGLAEVKLVPHVAASRPGEGEIFARGPQMLVGYTHAADEVGLFDDEGFYRTGDIGYFVDGDYLVISGRAKDIIIRNGENIAPKDVEDAVGAHPDVLEVAVVGIPDARTGERACAVIVPRGDRAPDLEAVVTFLRGCGLASFKLPEQVESWTALPKNATGKVLKHEIRATLIARARG